MLGPVTIKFSRPGDGVCPVGKVAYEARDDAERAASRLKSRAPTKPRGGSLNVFRCGVGDHYHVGSVTGGHRR